MPPDKAGRPSPPQVSVGVNSIRIPLVCLEAPSWSPDRAAEPVTMGVPLPAGMAQSPAHIRLEGPNGQELPVQLRTLDRWPDGSLRWVLVDFQADAIAGHVGPYSLQLGEPTHTAPGRAVHVSPTDSGVRVSTGAAEFGFAVGGPFPFSSLDTGSGSSPVELGQSGFRIDLEGKRIDFVVSSVQIHDTGPLRAEIEVAATARDTPSSTPLQVSARVELFAATATARVSVTIRNRRRATHPNGRWTLGDTGSVFLESATISLRLDGPPERVWCAPELGTPLSEVDAPLEVYQESSGGEGWNGPVHKNREGRVPLRFRGYRLRSGKSDRVGHRASPVVVVNTSGGQVAVAVPQFWENFPRAVTVTDSSIELGLFPAQFGDRHELQGGEQKTHRFVVAFAPDPVSHPPLAWCHEPIRLSASAEWHCRTQAVPFLALAAGGPDEAYEALVAAALDPADGFLAKRETADEYGWRNFGDLPADHESAFLASGQRFVSHYNNQYDAIAGFAIHFLWSGDARWWHLMDDLARHVRDIDIYHTTEDKAAYNGGMFWHTQHYMDAGTSTHRTYPDGSGGGGPASEHNYNAGLMLHYFLTGERASRDAAVGLGQWVLDMDDGRKTPLRWLAAGPTGLASASGSMAYHGPGRGAANSILACLVAHRLTGDGRYMAKADELVRRSIHPRDDIAARHLFDVERRWYYTVFLQALGVYLHGKQERGEIDEMYIYARESLVHYARWMAEHERPYLEHAEGLEYPTETWVAQDMRKGCALLHAADHAAPSERDRFLAGAQRFYDYSVGTLMAMPEHRFTRPLILVLTNGIQFSRLRTEAWASRSEPVPMPAELGAPRPFEPQKPRAIRRAALIAAAGLAALVSLTILRGL